jgi:hypothetical protein
MPLREVVGEGAEPFLVAMYYADDSPPVLGTFPKSAREAAGYIFDHSQLGARDFAIIVDGQWTCIDPSYVAGPVLTAPLLEGGGAHFISVGAFLTPLGVGTHTVTMIGTISGDAFVAGTGLSFETAAFTYQVKVVGGHWSDDGFVPGHVGAGSVRRPPAF